MIDRFKVVPQHGEAASLFYVVDTEALNEDQPAVVATHHDARQARRDARERNLAEQEA